VVVERFDGVGQDAGDAERCIDLFGEEVTVAER
jgi:hypothetical protein